METSLDDDIERVCSIISQESAAESETTIRVILNTTDSQTMQIAVHRDEAIYEAVSRCLECEAATIQYVQLGDDAVGVNGESFREEEIEDGAKLGVCVVGLSFEDVVDATVALNAGNRFVTKEKLMAFVSLNPDDPLHVKGNLHWAGLHLKVLPDIIGKLKIDGNFMLGFAFYRDISGNMQLGHNELSRLPDSFGQMQIGGELDLSSNKLSTLPESFGQLTVGGLVRLYQNNFEPPYPEYDGIEIEWESIMEEVD